MKGAKRHPAERIFTCSVVVLLVLLLLITAGRLTSAQTPAPWGGWVQCRFDVQGTGYTHQEVQTWTITGPPVTQSTVEVYPASWSVSGQGTLKKMTDASTTEAADWTVAVPPTVARIGITPHADRFTIQRWTAQLVAGGGLIGKDVLTTLSAPPRVTSMTLSVDEQPFSTIDVDLKSTQTNGSSMPVVSGTVGPIRPKDAQGKGNCAWQFARGGIATLVPPDPLSDRVAVMAATTQTTASPTLTAAPLSSATPTATTTPQTTATATTTATRDRTLSPTVASALTAYVEAAPTVVTATVIPAGVVKGSLSGPTKLAAGAQGTFQLALIAPAPVTSSTTSSSQAQTGPDQITTRIQTDTTTTTDIIQSVNLTFDSNEGETSTPTLSAASTSPALSSTFTFQMVGTYSVSVRGTVTTQVTAVTARTVTTTVTTHVASCNCDTKMSTVNTTPNAMTQISTSSYQVSVSLPVTIAAQ